MLPSFFSIILLVKECWFFRLLVTEICIFLHSANVCANIRRLNENKPLKPYKAGRSAMVVPVGKSGGASELPNGMVMGNFFTKKVKGEGLLIANVWKNMKQKVPQQ